MLCRGAFHVFEPFKPFEDPPAKLRRGAVDHMFFFRDSCLVIPRVRCGNGAKSISDDTDGMGRNMGCCDSLSCGVRRVTGSIIAGIYGFCCRMGRQGCFPDDMHIEFTGFHPLSKRLYCIARTDIPRMVPFEIGEDTFGTVRSPGAKRQVVSAVEQDPEVLVPAPVPFFKLLPYVRTVRGTGTAARMFHMPHNAFFKGGVGGKGVFEVPRFVSLHRSFGMNFEPGVGIGPTL